MKIEFKTEMEEVDERTNEFPIRGRLHYFFLKSCTTYRLYVLNTKVSGAVSNSCDTVHDACSAHLGHESHYLLLPTFRELPQPGRGPGWPDTMVALRGCSPLTNSHTDPRRYQPYSAGPFKSGNLCQ